jgi:protein-export membrane protein SecD
MGSGKLTALLVGFVVVVGAMWAAIAGLGLSPRLGLDLQGGVSVNLVPSEGQGEVPDGVLNQTVSIIRRRVDALGVAEPDIVRQGDNVLVQLPGFTDQQRAEKVIGQTAQLQFRPVLEVIRPGSQGYESAGRSCTETRDAPPPPDQEVVVCQAPRDTQGAQGGASAQPTPAASATPRSEWNKLRLGPVAVAGERIADANAQTGRSGVQWNVQLELDDRGAAQFADITGRLACNPRGSPTRRLGIVLDGVVESSPPMAQSVQCNQGIPNGQAQITTGGGEQEARELALILRTGALPIQLDFATSRQVSPTLGSDSLTAGLTAGFIGLALVAIYLMVLYRGMGLAAVAELAMFGVIVYGVLIVLGEVVGFTLTLAGIAGIIVSIGIAADSSIIYRERYRDEVRAGRTVRTAADHAFHSAFRTNLNGNTVSFLAAAVLYFIAVGPVRGFAFTLGLSTLVDTLLFATFTRALFGLIARSPKLARSKLVGLRSGATAAGIGGTTRAKA